MVRRPYISWPRRGRLRRSDPVARTVTPVSVTSLSYAGYPHIIESIILHSDANTQTTFRRTCTSLRQFVDRHKAQGGILFEYLGDGGARSMRGGFKLPVFHPASSKKRQLDVMARCPRVMVAGGSPIPYFEELLAAVPDGCPVSIMHDGTGPPLNLAVLAPLYLDIDALVRCRCSRAAPEAVFSHAATHLTVHLTLPAAFGNEGASGCSILRGLWSPTVQRLQLCFEMPDWPFEHIIACLFPQPLAVHPDLRVSFHFAWWVSYGLVAKARALRRLLAGHFQIPVERVNEVNAVRPFPTMPRVTCAHTPERPYSR